MQRIRRIGILPALVAGLVVFSWARGARVYASVVEGAKEGFGTAVKIIPYLIAILVAIGVFRASGAMDWLISGFPGVWNRQVGIPILYRHYQRL